MESYIGQLNLTSFYGTLFKYDEFDVLCDYIKLPAPAGADPGSERRLRCIGSYKERLQYAESLRNSLSMRIWVLSEDSSEWSLKHCIVFETLVNHPQLLDLHMIMFPAEALYKKFKPLAFDPVSDSVIIWTPKRIFSYYYNTGNLVSLTLQCPDAYTDELKHPPRDAFLFTRRLMPLSITLSHRDFRKKSSSSTPQ